MATCFLAIATAAVLLLSAVAAAGAQTLPATFSAAAPVASANAAVAEAIQTGGATYAGDCADTTPANIGQDCSKFVAADGSMQAYAIGPAFSEFTDWVFVSQTKSGWIPVGSADFDGTAGAPTVPWPAG